MVWLTYGVLVWIGQILPQTSENIEYVGKENEFDVVLDVDHDDEAAKRNKIGEEAIVNVIAMDDESGDEDGLFYFDVKMRNDKARV